MKNMTSSEISAPSANPAATALRRFEIYRQTHPGAYIAEFKTDSAAEAVEAFLNISPAFEGAGLRIWSHREQRVSASVEWITEEADFGFPVRHRKNIFHDRLLGLIARQIHIREEIRAEFQQGGRLCV